MEHEIFRCIYKDDLEGCRRYLDQGIDPNLQHEDGSLLYEALSHSDYVNTRMFVQLLLERGADPNIKNRCNTSPSSKYCNGRVPLHCASMHHNPLFRIWITDHLIDYFKQIQAMISSSEIEEWFVALFGE